MSKSTTCKHRYSATYASGKQYCIDCGELEQSTIKTKSDKDINVPIKTTSDYQEVDKIVESFFKNEITFGETKEKLHSELDRVREEVVKECLEAVKDTENVWEYLPTDDVFGVGWNHAIGKVTKNIKLLAKNNK